MKKILFILLLSPFASQAQEILSFIRVVKHANGKIGLYYFDNTDTTTDGYEKVKHPNGRLVRLNISDLGLEDLQPQATEVSSNNYTVLASDFGKTLESTGNGNSRIFTLPDASTITNKYLLTIKDGNGNASQKNITINCASGDHIQGSTSITIDQDYGQITIYKKNDNIYFLK